MIHNIFCTYYISLDNNFHRIVFFRDVTNIIDYKKFASINTRTWTPWPRVSAMGVSERKKLVPRPTLCARMCAASHAHASCIVTWHGSPANEPLLLLPFVAVYVFPATSSNTLERPLDYKPPSLSLSLSRLRPPLRPSRSCFSLFLIPRSSSRCARRCVRGVVHTK